MAGPRFVCPDEAADVLADMLPASPHEVLRIVGHMLVDWEWRLNWRVINNFRYLGGQDGIYRSAFAYATGFDADDEPRVLADNPVLTEFYLLLAFDLTVVVPTQPRRDKLMQFLCELRVFSYELHARPSDVSGLRTLRYRRWPLIQKAWPADAWARMLKAGETWAKRLEATWRTDPAMCESRLLGHAVDTFIQCVPPAPEAPRT